jgi:hypothetical protein
MAGAKKGQTVVFVNGVEDADVLTKALRIAMSHVV